MFNLRKRKFLLFLAWSFATGLLYLCFREIEFARAWEGIKQAHPLWLLLGIAGHFSIFWFWSRQWILFLPAAFNVSFMRMFEINALMSTAMNTLPFPGGHALGVVLLAKRERVGHAAALSVMSLDQLAEGIAKLTALLIVAWLTPLPPLMKQGIIGLVGVVFCFLLVLLYFAHRFRDIEPADPDHHRSRKEKFVHFVSHWGHHLEGLRDGRTFIIGVILAYGMKIGEAAAIWGVQKSFGLDLPVWSVLLILAALNLTTMVPLAPGNLGVYEATVFFIYKYLGVSPEQALGLALVQHLCFLLPLAGTGYIFLLTRNFIPQKTSTLAEPAEEASTP
ncbi:hypothetical protein UZ36_03745 [Candidatus Nitromaritima sp. SCGC AAA799-C22]|nr:hypothetical protein UZ36_03745 [Candidatus Nitromaritima sp. SCGC AAA799-C22]